MKIPTPRELLIKKACRDHANAGTEWRDRTDAWLADRVWDDANDIPWPPPPCIRYTGDFFAATYVLADQDAFVPKFTLRSMYERG